ncbi:YfiR family protein [Acinetobacter sp. MD2]|uniref:YfiR family protein n=1 Tax=Acinetobacter sp. MD2 TaxID=2600066 RepID=UPI002D1F90A8|nr:YfiR family protein [Acinetobacter sp. MD2]MEB3768107.1 YfiR family protein [Acinetobacter sp. MD2]
MHHKKIKRCSVLLFSFWLSFSAYATSTQNFLEITLSILSYAKWNTNVNTPNLCIVNNPNLVGQFKLLVQQQHANYNIIPIDLKLLDQSTCQAIYFSTLSAKEEQAALNHHIHSPTLSFSSNNTECDIGSAFCLYKRNGLTSFKVNLDSLSQSKIRVDPRVLLLAKPLEQSL